MLIVSSHVNFIKNHPFIIKQPNRNRGEKTAVIELVSTRWFQGEATDFKYKCK
jgi:hypothetical protein